tara:strand:+ start:27 stop:221 length:195 start_codon:yes stop_codon:yes gene_type:complete
MPEDTVKNEVKKEEVAEKAVASSKKKKASAKKAPASKVVEEVPAAPVAKPKPTVTPRASNRRRN